MKLTKQQKKEIKKQEECKHEWKEIKIKDDMMLNGFRTELECTKCPMKRLYFRVEIEWILQHMAKDLNRPRNKLTADNIMYLSKKFFNAQITREDAELLLANPTKYI